MEKGRRYSCRIRTSGSQVETSVFCPIVEAMAEDAARFFRVTPLRVTAGNINVETVAGEGPSIASVADEVKLMYSYVARELASLHRRVDQLSALAERTWTIEQLFDKRLEIFEHKKMKDPDLWEIVMYAIWLFWNKIQELRGKAGVSPLSKSTILQHIVHEPEVSESP